MSQKVVLITGAGRGIGAACAELAARQGYAVCVNYHANEQAADQLVRTIEAAGGRALAVQADVASEISVGNLFAVIDNHFGRLDALVNNAGILAPQMRLEQMDAARLNHLFATNITGAFLCAREAVRRMSTRHGGSGGAIVNLSSRAAQLGAPGEYIDYAASKAAIEAMTVGLAKEVVTEGIRVNGVRPGLIYTDIHASSGEPGRVDRLKDLVPMRRGGSAAEVAAAVMWLLSEQASYTTASFIDVAGGR